MTSMILSAFRIFSLFLLILPAAFQMPVSAAEGDHKKSADKYECPDVTLLNQDREEINLRKLVNGDKPVMLEFVFTSCQTICPIMSAGFSTFQEKMGEKAGEVRLVSISIDPQHDTPERMKKYLAKYGARTGWDFFTGEKPDIDSVTTAFKARTSDKMEHRPLTFLRAPSDEAWVRLEGLLSGSDLMKEYRELIAE